MSAFTECSVSNNMQADRRGDFKLSLYDLLEKEPIRVGPDSAESREKALLRYQMLTRGQVSESQFEDIGRLWMLYHQREEHGGHGRGPMAPPHQDLQLERLPSPLSIPRQQQQRERASTPQGPRPLPKLARQLAVSSIPHATLKPSVVSLDPEDRDDESGALSIKAEARPTSASETRPRRPSIHIPEFPPPPEIPTPSPWHKLAYSTSTRRKSSHRGSTFEEVTDWNWALRAPAEDLYEHLEDLFSEHDLNKRVTNIALRSGSSSPPITGVADKQNTMVEQANGVSTASSARKPVFKWVRGEMIGEGASGSVYLALNATTGEIIAVKQVEIPTTSNDNSNPRRVSAIEALKGESAILADLDHPNILEYFGYEETPKSLSIFLEYVPGGSIGSCLRKYGKFDQDVTKSFISQILSGLEYLHFRGILHGDLKADNILLETFGTCKISSFGVSKRNVGMDVERDDNQFIPKEGSLFWMAPEVINGKGYDTKVDIWSVGCIALEMWTAKRPWQQFENVAVMKKLYYNKQLSPIPEEVALSPAAHDFRSQCFAINPERRSTAADLRRHFYLVLPPDWVFNGFLGSHPEGSVPIHKATLPKSKRSLDDALYSFETELSPWKSPKEWLNANSNHISSIVQETVALTKLAEIEEVLVNRSMIYCRLIVYTYMRVMHRADGERIHSEFKETLRRWQSWDIITLMHNHQLIRDTLLNWFRLDLKLHPHLHSESLLGKLLTLDVIALCARLAVMVTEDSIYKSIVGLRGPGAQVFLNLLQARLDFPIDPKYKPRHVKTLIKLSQASGVYPECLVLKGIETEGDAVAGGGFGDVYKGRLHGREIGIKVLRIYRTSDMEKLLKEFSSEAVTWSQLSHPNVLPFYGVFRLDKNTPQLCLACPWMENGNILQFLADCAPDTDCVLLSLDVARGLEYLHGESIIHGDLKGLNILVSQSRRALLADFGLAAAKDSNPTVITYVSKQIGTLRWQAPELFPDMRKPEVASTTPHNTVATDVYAFALVCFEMFSGEYPFKDIKNDFQVIFAAQQGKRPSRPLHDLSRRRGLDDETWDLIGTCWAAEPMERPTTGEVVERLRAKRPVDHRPLDNFNISSPSRILRSEADHPFSVLSQYSIYRIDASLEIESQPTMPV